MGVVTASNKTANYLLFLLGVVGFYLLLVFGFPWMDNVQLKTFAREWIAASRNEQDEEKAREGFKRNAASLGIKLNEDSCTIERIDENRARVKCAYVKNAEFFGLGKYKPVKFRWTVEMKYRQY